jgi:hypothetical protein
MNELEQLFTTAQTAKKLNISKGVLQNSRCSGIGVVIPYTRIGGSIRYRQSDIERYIEENTFNNTGECKEVR